MKICLCVVFANFICLINCESICKSPNTGTVLYRNIDLYRRKCWRKEELAMTYARRAMVDLVPKQIPHDLPVILEYIQICMTTLKEVAKTTEVYDLMAAALADTFGGYLQTYGLPLVHEAYYEGYVSYDTAKDVHRVFDDFKFLLMTNGDGWRKPMEVRKHINKVLPLKLPVAIGNKPCSLLMHDNRSQKVSVGEEGNDDGEASSLIPLPIIDDNKYLSTVAVPFKTRALYNLKNKHSYDILIKYYIEATRCLSIKEKGNEGLLEFDQRFSDWLKTTVTPHLKDNEWFVGFSNVLRIQETIQQRGGMIAYGKHADIEEDSLFKELENETQLTRTAYVVIIIILILSIIVLCFLYWTWIKNCLTCSGCGDLYSSNSQSTHDALSSLLSGIDDDKGCYPGPWRCKHRPDLKNSPVVVTEKSRLTLSCGQRKGQPGSRCRKHRH